MINITDFGEHRGQRVVRYTLENAHGTRLSVLNFAGIVQEFSVLDGDERVNLVLSSDDFDKLIADYNINRVIGRTAGRIRDGRWQQNGHEIITPPNENGHSLHGGAQGVGEQFFDVEVAENADVLTLTRTQTPEIDGFPGILAMTVQYELTADDQVKVTFTGAQSQADGVFNPTVHTYFNLADNGVEDVLTHDLWLNSTQHLAVDADKVPTGEILANANTPFDLQSQSDLGVVLPQMRAQTREGGFDDVFVVEPSLTQPVATLTDRASKRRVSIYSDRNAAVVFTASQLDATVVKGLNRGDGHPWLAVAIEAQNLPDSQHHSDFVVVTLLQDERVSHTIIYAYDKI